MTSRVATIAYCPITNEKLPPGRFVSGGAVKKLRDQLDGIGVLMRALDDALGKHMRFSSPEAPGGSGERPLPLNPAVAEESWVARQTLLVWVDHVARTHLVPCSDCGGRGRLDDDGQCPACVGVGRTTEAVPATWSEVGRFLDVRAHWLAGQPIAPQAFDELLHALGVARRAVDRPAERRYAGPCGGLTFDAEQRVIDCDGEVYAYGPSQTATCPRCGAEYSVEDRRGWMRDRMDDVLLPAADLARALAGLGVGVTSAQVRGWRHRGLLAAVDVNTKGQPLYVVGDAMDLAIKATENYPARVAAVGEALWARR